LVFEKTNVISACNTVLYFRKEKREMFLKRGLVKLQQIYVNRLRTMKYLVSIVNSELQEFLIT